MSKLPALTLILFGAGALLATACEVSRPRPEAGVVGDATGASDRRPGGDGLDSQARSDGFSNGDARSRPELSAGLDGKLPLDGKTTGDAGGVAGYLILTRAQLQALPTSGGAWSFMKSKADQAVATALSPSNPESPWLPNYNVVAPRYLAAALVHASAWSGNKAPYRKAVEDAIRHVIGSEEAASSDGTAAGDALLATCRQLSAWVMAADLIGLDGSLTGSRTGWTAISFDTWMAGILGKTIGTHGRWKSIAQCQESSASNWGAHCGASRLAVSLYRQDAQDLSRAITVLRGALGDSAAYPAYPEGQVPALGAGFQVTSSFDKSWACPYAAIVGGWKPINPSTCGPGHDGIVVEDAGRSAAAFPSWDATSIGYIYESLGAHHLSALLVSNAGQPAFSWSGDALKRSMLWLQREGQLPSTANSTTQRHISWVTNHFYGTSLPTQPAAMGRALGFTDWLFP